MTRDRAAMLVTLLIAAWAIWLPASAWLAASPAVGGLAPVIAATYHAGALVCHQLPERSFHVGRVQIAVCARCLGLYAGAAFGGLVGLLWRRWARRGAHPDDRLRHVRLVLIAAGVPTALLWLFEHGGGASVGNPVRFFLALPLGAAVAAVVVAWVAGVAFDAPPAGSAID